ncbi:hypothetical protein MCOR02_004844 [Pyricularia oryzae]|nr:hypothetical protein MCOR02_004844 [Pyricularia oryzae]
MRVSNIVRAMALLAVGTLAVPVATDASAIQPHAINHQGGLVARRIEGAAETTRPETPAGDEQHRPGKSHQSSRDSRHGRGGHSGHGKHGKPRPERRVHLVPRPATITCPDPKCHAHSRLESELEAAEEARRAADLKVERLRKQKKLWFERMMRAVSRGIDDLEELDRVEREEAEQEERRRSAEVLPEVSLESLLPDSNFVWDSTFPMGPLNPSLLDEMNVLAQHSVVPL